MLRHGGSLRLRKDKYDVSKAIGELELLPAVRQAPTDWLIVADGFSCREQIAQETDRHTLHLAEVLQMALREASETPEGFPLFDPAPQHYPEDALVSAACCSRLAYSRLGSLYSKTGSH
jgi:hypothetical protein